MDAEEWLNKGNEFAERGNYKKALEAYDKAAEIDPQYVAAWHGKGFALGELKRYQEALEAYDKAAEINPQYVAAWHGKGFALGELKRNQEALEAYDKAAEIDPQYVAAWLGKGNALGKLERYQEAIEACRKATDLKPQDAIAHSNLGEFLLEVGDIEGASREVQEALNLNKDFPEALSLQGRIHIEQRGYGTARESFEKAISLSPGDLKLLLWDAYAHYLETEFSLSPKSRAYQEEITAIIKTLDRVDMLSSKRNDDVKAHILYFLGCFHYKAKDMFSAKERLSECVKLCVKLESEMKKPSSTKASARELLDHIWSYQIRPGFWRWWLDSPVHCWLRRAGFAVLAGVLCTLLVVHPFLPHWYPELQINWTLYMLSVGLLLVFLFLPIIERIRTRELEVELRPPPSLESVLSPGEMEKIVKEIEAEPPQLK